MYALFWPTKGNPGINEYTFLSIVNGASVWIGDTCKMVQDILQCSPGVANRLAWSLFVPEKVTKQKGGIATLYEDDAITLSIECTRWAHANGIPFSFTLTRVLPRV